MGKFRFYPSTSKTLKHKLLTLVNIDTHDELKSTYQKHNRGFKLFPSNTYSIESWVYNIVDPGRGDALFNHLSLIKRVQLVSDSVAYRVQKPILLPCDLRRKFEDLKHYVIDLGGRVSWDDKDVTREIMDAITKPSDSIMRSARFFLHSFWANVYTFEYDQIEMLFKCKNSCLSNNTFFSELYNPEDYGELVNLTMRVEGYVDVADTSVFPSKKFARELRLSTNLSEKKRAVSGIPKRGMLVKFETYMHHIKEFNDFITMWLFKILIHKNMAICLQYDASNLNRRESIIIKVSIPDFGDHDVDPPTHNFFNADTIVFLKDSDEVTALQYLDTLKRCTYVALCKRVDTDKPQYADPPYPRTSRSGKKGYDIAVTVLDFLVNMDVLSSYALPTKRKNGGSHSDFEPLLILNDVQEHQFKITYVLDKEREIELEFVDGKHPVIVIGTDGGKPELQFIEMLTRRYEQFMHSPCFAHVSHNMLCIINGFDINVKESMRPSGERFFYQLCNAINWNEFRSGINDNSIRLEDRFNLFLNNFYNNRVDFDSEFFVGAILPICLRETFGNGHIHMEKNPINRWTNGKEVKYVDLKENEKESRSNPMEIEHFLIGYENRILQELKSRGNSAGYLEILADMSNIDDRTKFEEYEEFAYKNGNFPINVMFEMLSREEEEIKFLALVQSLIDLQLWRMFFLEDENDPLQRVRWQATEQFGKAIWNDVEPRVFAENFNLGDDLLECCNIFQAFIEYVMWIQRLACSDHNMVQHIHFQIAALLKFLTNCKEFNINKSIVYRYASALRIFTVRYMSKNYIQAQSLVAFLLCDVDSVQLSKSDIESTFVNDEGPLHKNYINSLDEKFRKPITHQDLEYMKVVLCHSFLPSRMNPDKENSVDNISRCNWSRKCSHFLENVRERGDKVQGLVGYIASVLEDSRHFNYSPNDPVDLTISLSVELQQNQTHSGNNYFSLFKNISPLRRRSRNASRTAFDLSPITRKLPRVSPEVEEEEMESRSVRSAITYLNCAAVETHFRNESEEDKHFVNSEMIRIAFTEGYTKLPDYLHAGFKKFMQPFDNCTGSVEGGFSALGNIIGKQQYKISDEKYYLLFMAKQCKGTPIMPFDKI
ncbi:hypothetical protein PCE1_000604 [Barthelona sp. PCE]